MGPGVTDTSFSDLAEGNRTPSEYWSGRPGNTRCAFHWPALPPGISGELSRIDQRRQAVLVVAAEVARRCDAVARYAGNRRLLLGFQKWLGGGKLEPRQSANVRPVAETSGAAIPPVQADQSAKPVDSTSKATESPATVETPPAIKEPEPSQAAAAPPPAVDGAQPTHSLQAASFPNEPGAKEFAEKWSALECRPTSFRSIYRVAGSGSEFVSANSQTPQRRRSIQPRLDSEPERQESIWT